jgi:hypothetical protein
MHIEHLKWHATACAMPDADITVLMWIEPDSIWAGGWWDDEDWRYCESGGVVVGQVTHWAEPEGPAT